METLTPPTGIRDWLACLAFAMWIIHTGWKLINLGKGKPSLPPNEQLALSNAALKEQFDKHVAHNQREHENIFSRLGGSTRGIEEKLSAKIEKFEADSKESRREMHRQIDDLGKNVAALEATADLTNQRIVQMDGKLDRLIEKKNHES